MDPLTLFGLLAVTAMLVYCTLEDRNRLYILAFAGACALDRYMDFSKAHGRSASSNSLPDAGG
jgi:hypothetical protein